ncbi:MAG: alpha/beta hydrolase [Hyphomicrobiaceae bacterium]|nr:alpha/beta hydrolase [Hyphomicrobiaceae bacterium]
MLPKQNKTISLLKAASSLWLAIAVTLVMSTAMAAGSAAEARSYRISAHAPGMQPVQLHVQDHGAGPPVVLLHGLGASGYMWRHLTSELASRHRVIAIDFKGFGKSQKPIDFRYSIDDHAAMVASVIDQLNLRSVTLVGHSFGGAVALLLAVKYDQTGDSRIARLILMNSPAYPQPMSAGVKLLNKGLLSYLALNVVSPEFAARNILQDGGSGTGKFMRRDILAYAYPFQFRGARHALIETGRQIVPADFGRTIKWYPRLQIPVLILWCRHDRTVPLEIGRRLASDLPDSKLSIFDTCNHIPPESSQQETRREVLAFLRDAR